MKRPRAVDFLCAAFLTAPHAGVHAEQTTVVWAGTLIAEAGRPTQTERSLVIRNGVIEQVAAGYVSIENAQTIDLRSSTVLPGLIDCHVHLLTEYGPSTQLDAVQKSDVRLAFDGAVYAKRTLEAGFTTVADLGGDTDAIFGLRDAIASGQVPGPRIVAAGLAITPSGGHGDVHGYRQEVLGVLRQNNSCNGADDCRRAVREAVQEGADIIKVTATGGVLSNIGGGLEQQMTDAELLAVVETAHSLSRRVAAHAHGKSGIDAALRAGVDSLEHGFFADATSFGLFRKHDTYLVPSMLAGVAVSENASHSDTWMPPSIREKALKLADVALTAARRAHEAGVKIAYGTDSGVSPHGDNAREFALLVQAGLTPAEAIRAATVNAADHLRLSDRVGTLVPGKQADLIAVRRNPLENVAELRDVPFVMKAGIVYKSTSN